MRYPCAIMYVYLYVCAHALCFADQDPAEYFLNCDEVVQSPFLKAWQATYIEAKLDYKLHCDGNDLYLGLKVFKGSRVRREFVFGGVVVI